MGEGQPRTLDTSGSALTGVLAGGRDRLPHLIKPNAEELAELVGRPLGTVGSVADAARDLVGAGVQTVLVSLGGAGAVLVEDGLALHGTAGAQRVVNTAGAGDAFLAGYLARAGSPARYRLASALRYGSAAVGRAGTLLADPPDTSGDGPAAGVHVGDVDAVRDQPLGDAGSPPGAQRLV